MKLDWKASLLILLIASVVGFICKGSNLPFLVALEPLLTVYVIVLAVRSTWDVTVIYIAFSVIMDLCLIQPVGLVEASVFIAFALIKVINRFFNLMGDSMFLYNLLVVVTSLFVRILLQYLFGTALLVIDIGTIIGIIMVYVVVNLVIQIIFKGNVYKR
jgi:hypothetical protein